MQRGRKLITPFYKRPLSRETLNNIFTPLHEMQTRSSDENSVCPSVRLSVKRVICYKTKE